MTDKSPTTAILFDRKAKEREFDIPKGWRIVKDDTARCGDCWWRWSDESWQPIGEHAFLGQHGTLLQCLIRKVQNV